MSGLMIGLIVTVHVLACLALMVAILLQSGKGGGLAGAFGGGSSQTLFGGRGAAGFLSRATTVLAIVFFLTSLTLGITSSRQVGTRSRSLVQEEARRRARSGAPGAATTAPQVPQSPEPPPAGQAVGPATPQPGSNPAPATGTNPPPDQGSGTAPGTGGTR